jgi:hypothetical protein
VPAKWTNQISIANFLQPVLKYLKPTLRRSAEAAEDVVDFAVSPECAGRQGYFIMRTKAESSRASLDEEMQRALWDKSVEWAGISQGDTVLPL